MKKILVTGATGFIGSRLCEALWLTGVYKPVAFVHSTASASRLARLPMNFVIGDLLDSISVKRAAEGCDAVVHLARGDTQVMRKGLKNVLRTAVECSMERFVHLSSVAVYGDMPSVACASEVPVPHSVDNPYGNEKLKQERLVERFHNKTGLKTVILRPPNIYGPFSYFTINLMERLRRGNLPLVGEGQTPCNLVYIDNVIEAIFLALWKPNVAGEAFFVMDSQVPTWAECLRDHAAMIGVEIPTVCREDLVTRPQENLLLESLRQIPRVLVSSELRKALKKIPLAERAEALVRSGFDALPSEMRDYLRQAANGPEIIERNGQVHYYATDNLILAQQRGVAHSSEKAKRLLGYKASVTRESGMMLTQEWLRFAHII
jgi:nucleoside-diphosphate-sugar epimerase